jgi:2-hydroxychromene-2-carboxylate isomerase
MATATLDFWFEFSSTYSYPATMRIGALAAHARVAVRLRPFLPGPIFQAQGWNTSPFNLYPAKGRHMWRDLERICAELKLPFRRPDLFPQSGLLAARVALAGLQQPAGSAVWVEDFCRAVYRAQFAEGRRIDQPETILAILSVLKVEAEHGGGALDRHQGQASCANGRGATAGNFRLANVHHLGWRDVLGKRQARERNRLGQARVLIHSVVSGIPSSPFLSDRRSTRGSFRA